MSGRQTGQTDVCMRVRVHLCVQWGVLAKLNALSSGLGEEKRVYVCACVRLRAAVTTAETSLVEKTIQLHNAILAFQFNDWCTNACARTHTNVHTHTQPNIQCYLLSVWPGGQIKSCCGRISFWCGMLSESEKKSSASARCLSTANFSPNKIETAKTPKDVREPQLIVRPKWCKKQAARYSEDESEFLIAWLYTQKKSIIKQLSYPIVWK